MQSGIPPTASFAAYAGIPHGYGGEVSEKPYDRPTSVFAPGARRRFNIVGICVNIFVPWFLFSALYGMMSFAYHYHHPVGARVFLFCGLIAPLVSGVLAMVYQRREMQVPMWFTYSAIACFVAVIAAGVCGDMNFWYNMQPYYDLQNLNTYPAVNPSQWKGQQLMDSGRVYFASGTNLDVKKAMGFKNHDTYCVAPIVHGNDKMANYDFWAVGVNCCSDSSAGFHCGEFNNPHARSGLRMMRDDQRPFFRLAVQQAEAAYNLQARHPIFYYWMQDPIHEVNSYRDDGFKFYIMGMFAFFVFNLFCVICSVIAFSKIGRY